MSTAVEVTGDVRELTLQRITIPATFSGTGHNNTGFFRLADTPAIRHFTDSYAFVQIEGSIRVEIAGPVTSTVATSALVALYPDKYADGPSTKDHVASLEGRVPIQHSLLVGSVSATPGQAREVGTSLKVRTLVDYKPVIAYHVDIAGGTSTSSWIITAHVPLAVGGVSHRKTW